MSTDKCEIILPDIQVARLQKPFALFLHAVEEPKHVSSDRFVLSKVRTHSTCPSFLVSHSCDLSMQGHACPILYAALCEVGLLSEEHLLTLRKVDSILEGHPTPVSLRALPDPLLQPVLLSFVYLFPFLFALLASKLHRRGHWFPGTRAGRGSRHGLLWQVLRQGKVNPPQNHSHP